MSGIPPRLAQSPVFAVGGGAQEVNLDPSFAHTFISVYSCDVNGDPLANYTAVSGKYDIEVLSQNCPVYQKPQHSNIKAGTPVDISVEGNLLKVKIAPDNIVGAQYFRIHTSQNVT